MFISSFWIIAPFKCVVKTELMSSNSAVLLFTGNLRLRLCPEGAAEAKTETLQQTDPCSCLSHSGICPKNTETEPQYSWGCELSLIPILLLRLSFHVAFTFILAWQACWHEIVLSNQYVAIFMPLQTSWRCFAVDNFDSATFKMFLRKRSNITASSLSTPKPKKSVSNHFIHFTVTAIHTQFPVYCTKAKLMQYEATALQYC